MWWDRQNLNKARTDKTGTNWNFRVWHEALSFEGPRDLPPQYYTLKGMQHVARVFFWDDKRRSTGVVLLGPNATTDVRALHSLIHKLASDPKLRTQHQRKLRFPLDRHYSEYGAFPEEAAILGSRVDRS